MDSTFFNLFPIDFSHWNYRAAIVAFCDNLYLGFFTKIEITLRGKYLIFSLNFRYKFLVEQFYMIFVEIPFQVPCQNIVLCSCMQNYKKNYKQFKNDENNIEFYSNISNLFAHNSYFKITSKIFLDYFLFLELLFS